MNNVAFVEAFTLLYLINPVLGNKQENFLKGLVSHACISMQNSGYNSTSLDS